MWQSLSSVRRFLLPVAIGMAALVAISFGADYFLRGQYIESTNDAYVQADTAAIAARVSGLVAAVEVQDNQIVKEGDVLVRIEPGDFRSRLDQADATFEAKSAAIANIEARLALEGAHVAQAESDLRSRQADAARADDDLTRYEALRDKGAASAQRYEQALADARVKREAVTGAEAAVSAAHEQVRVLETSLRQARADIKTAEAERALAQFDLDHTIIRAPFDGVVGNRVAEIGQYVRTGAQLLVIVPLPKVYVIANFKETQVAAMRRGQAVEIAIDAFSGDPLRGWIESFSPATGSEFSLIPPENATGNFTKVVQRVPVRIAIQPGDARLDLLRPGMSVIVSVDTRDEGEGSGATLGALPRPVTAASAP